jgi:hypothetical protein
VFAGASRFRWEMAEEEGVLVEVLKEGWLSQYQCRS